MSEIWKIEPNPGPQTEFLRCAADICFYGGQAGGGKTRGLLMEWFRGFNLPGYKAVIFRRTYPEIMDPGGLWDASVVLFAGTGATPRRSESEWVLPAGGRCKFSHLQHEQDKIKHQGAEYALVGVDEVTHFSEGQFWYMWSRCRTTCGIQAYLRATCNPDPDSWVRRFIAWWIDEATGLAIPGRSGVLRWMVRDKDEIRWGDSPSQLRERYPELFIADPDLEPISVTFIAAKLGDNPPLLLAQPGYKAKLQSLPLLERERLLGGNWNIRPAAGLYWRREWFQFTPREPEGVAKWIRAWDKAATQVTAQSPDPDWTVGVRYGVIPGRKGEKRYVIDGRSICRMRGSPHQVEQAMIRCAEQDGVTTTIAIWQDPGQAGVADVNHLSAVLSASRVRTTVARQSKQTYWGPPSSAAENGLVTVLVPESGPWPTELEALLSCLESVPDGKHDDDADALALAHIEAHNIAAYKGYHSVSSHKSQPDPRRRPDTFDEPRGGGIF